MCTESVPLVWDTDIAAGIDYLCALVIGLVLGAAGIMAYWNISLL